MATLEIFFKSWILAKKLFFLHDFKNVFFRACASPANGSASDQSSSFNSSSQSEPSMMRRSKPKDDARLREHKKYLGLTVLARRGDTFRQSQVGVKFF